MQRAVDDAFKEAGIEVAQRLGLTGTVEAAAQESRPRRAGGQAGGSGGKQSRASAGEGKRSAGEERIPSRYQNDDDEGTCHRLEDGDSATCPGP